ncbi:MAG TPA: T9SS type A sorting domain-containing protein [Bacteroidia bacterium]|nr:T9SS type A sorting domain-containing protein [Bacteroidia bacterium]
MKKISVLFTIFLTLYTASNAQVTFRNTYSGVTITSVSQTSDHGYIIAGFSTTFTLGSKDIVLIKTDSTGAITWSQTFGNNVNANADDIAANAVEIPGGAGNYVAGQFWNQGNNTYEVYVLKTDTGGNRLWSKTMYNGGYDKGMHVENDGTGGCYIVGWLGNSSKGYLGRLDAAGNLSWQFSIAYLTGAWILQSGRRTPDGGMICGGYDNELGAYEMFLVKTNSGGAIQWQAGYSMIGTFNFCYDVCLASDNGYLVAGGSAGINLVKVDGSGNVQWSNTYGAGPRAYSVRQCADTGFVVLANDISNNQYLMKTDSSGNVLWTTKYTGAYAINTVEQTSDGGFVLAMGSDVIKTDANGVTGCGETQVTLAASNLTLSTRTPAAYTTASFTNNTAADGSTSPVVPVSYCITTGVEDESGINPDASGEELRVENAEVYDVLGQKRLTLNPSPFGEGLRLDVSSLSAGIYFVRLISEKKTVTKKIVVVK